MTSCHQFTELFFLYLFSSRRTEAVGILKSLLKHNLITCVVSPYPASDQLSTDSGLPFRLVTTSKSSSTFSQHPSQPQYSGATSLPPFVRSCSALDNLTGTDVRTAAGARGAIPASAMSRVGFGQQKAEACGEGGLGAVSYSKASDSVRASPACISPQQDLSLSDGACAWDVGIIMIVMNFHSLAVFFQFINITHVLNDQHNYYKMQYECSNGIY